MLDGVNELWNLEFGSDAQIDSRRFLIVTLVDGRAREPGAGWRQIAIWLAGHEGIGPTDWSAGRAQNHHLGQWHRIHQPRRVRMGAYLTRWRIQEATDGAENTQRGFGPRPLLTLMNAVWQRCFVSRWCGPDTSILQVLYYLRVGPEGSPSHVAR